MIWHQWSSVNCLMLLQTCTYHSWLPDRCNRWPIAALVIKLPQSSFFQRCLPVISSPCTVRMTSQIPRLTLVSLHISQFLNSHLTQLWFMYLCDLTSDPWMVILSQTRIEYGLWLTSQHTSGKPVFYYTLYMYVEHGDRDVLYLLWAISSHYSLWTLITPVAFILALCVCLNACRMLVCVGCVAYVHLCVWICVCGGTLVCQRHGAAAAHLPQPPCWLFHWWQNASNPPHPKKTDDAVAPKSLL